MLRTIGLVVIFGGTLYAQTYNTSCTLYPGAAYCTTTAADGGAKRAAAERQQQYEAGQQIGAGIGMGIFRAYFPRWRRKYCSHHPEQPYDYRNSAGDSITGTCPTLNQLANEAAGEFHGKHPYAVQSPEHAQAMDKYIADNKLSPWEPKSYEKAAAATAPQNDKKVPVKSDSEQQAAIKTQEPPQPAAQTAAASIDTPAIEAPAAQDTASEFPKRWKCIQNGEIHELRFHGDYIYAEQILTEADAKTGLYFLYEVKKDGDKYVGTFKGRIIDGSNSCPITFPAELTSVTRERIEGRMLLPQMTSKIDWNTCQWSTHTSWAEFSWIPVK